MRGMEHRNWRKQRMKRIMLEREVMVSIEGCVFFTDHTAVMVIKLHEQQGKGSFGRNIIKNVLDLFKAS